MLQWGKFIHSYTSRHYITGIGHLYKQIFTALWSIFYTMPLQYNTRSIFWPFWMQIEKESPTIYLEINASINNL